PGGHGRLYRLSERAFTMLLNAYAATLGWVLRHQRVTLLVMLVTIGLNIYLFAIVPKGFFPQQDSGRIIGSIQASQDISFPAMREKMAEFVNIVLTDPAATAVVAFTGGNLNTQNTGRMFISLKPLHERKVSADQIIGRLRGKLAHVPGANLFLQSVQDLRIGGRASNAQFQYTLQSTDLTELNTTPLPVNHPGFFPSVTLSFNLAPGIALSDAVTSIQGAERDVGLPASVRASFQGTAQAFQDSLSNQPILILAALITVYIVLGVLYESYVHPITILSTLPSAGVGAVIALMLCGVDLNVIALIGIILLIGIVKKNAIMMIDVALDVERREGKAPAAAIYEACLLRFRPIMMTTSAALLGALPLAVGTGTGAELRRPLGITIVGGLLVSQALTLYTTPVVYLYLERLRLHLRRARPVAVSHRSPELQH